MFKGSSRIDEPSRVGSRSHVTILKPRPDSSMISSLMTTDFLNALTMVEKESWNDRKEFFFSILVYLLNLAHIWRFPREALLYGNGSFVWLYIIFVLLLGSLLLFFEVALGQYSNKGYARVFAMCPLFEGISYSMSFYCFVVAIFYNTLNVYTLVYLLSSFIPNLPYKQCSLIQPNCSEGNISDEYSSEYVFFRDNVLHYMTKNPLMIHTETNYRNIGILLFLWAFIAIGIINGIRTSRMVSLFLWPVPYVVFLIVVSITMTLPGALHGISKMFIITLKEITSGSTWIHAFEQSLLSLGIGVGSLIIYGSFANFQSPTNLDCIWLCVATLACSLLCGMVMFGTVGVLSQQAQIPFEDVVRIHTPNLEIHVLFSQLVTRLRYGLSHFVAVLFYMMLTIVGVYAVMGYTEHFITIIYTSRYFNPGYKVHINIIVCGIFFILGSMFNTTPGRYVMQLIDIYMLGTPLFFIVLCELVAVIYIYGVYAFCDDIEFMIGLYPNTYYQFFWISLPITFLIGFIIRLYLFNTENTFGYTILLVTICSTFVPVTLKCLINIYEFYKRGDLLQVIYPREAILPSPDDFINSEIASTTANTFRRGRRLSDL